MKAGSVLRLVLVACCLCLVGSIVAFTSAQEAESIEGAKVKLDGARAQLDKAIGENPGTDELTAAAKKFIDAANKPDDLHGLELATKALQKALDSEKKKSQENGKTFKEGDKVLAINQATQAATAYLTLSDANKTMTAPPAKTQSGVGNDSGNKPDSFSLLDLVWPIAGGVAGLGLIVLAVFAGIRLRAGYWEKLNGHLNQVVQAHTAGIKKRQDELNKTVTAIAEEQRRAASNLENLRGENQALGRAVRQGVMDGAAANASRMGVDVLNRPAKPEEPSFPANAADYLNRMKKHASVVKPDFQNGILVSDLDGKGELVLIRDSNIPDDLQPLFVVPRVTQFQSKQEFYAYYEKYYDCQRPAAGEVWIIDAAVVSTVPGGWQLREKGVLEVR